MLHNFLISIFATSLFGIVDAIFFLFAEDTLQEKILKFKFFDGLSSELLTGGISASIAIFVSSFLGMLIRKKYKIIENPLFDAIGILVGTIVVLLFYKIFKIRLFQSIFKKKHSKKKEFLLNY